MLATISEAQEVGAHVRLAGCLELGGRRSQMAVAPAEKGRQAVLRVSHEADEGSAQLPFFAVGLLLAAGAGALLLQGDSSEAVDDKKATEAC